VSGGSPDPDLQRLAVHLLDLQIKHRFSLTFVWVPRDLNVRADFLSHVSEMRHHHYHLSEEWFAYLDGLWDPHTIDRFTSADNRQPLCPRPRGTSAHSTSSSNRKRPNGWTPSPSRGGARMTGCSRRPISWALRRRTYEPAARPQRSSAQRPLGSLVAHAPLRSRLGPGRAPGRPPGTPLPPSTIYPGAT
jgi:hypothetical protein